MSEADNPIEAALNQLLQERIDLDAAIRALQKRLGRPVSGSSATVNSNGMSATNAQPMAEAVVYRGEFYGLSVPKAAIKLLKRVGRPLKTPEVLESFTKAGFEIKSKTPRANIYTALVRSKEFVRVLPDTWGLAEWHPEIAAAKAAKEDAAKAARAKRHARPKGAKPKAVTSSEATEPAA